MQKMTLAERNRSRNIDEKLLFFRRWLRHPLRLGAVAPSSTALASLIAKQVMLNPENIVVELGAGTGRLTRSLLKAGIPADRLYVLEIDPEFFGFLKKHFSQTHLIRGDACHLPNLIPSRFVGHVSTIVSGMPVSTMPLPLQKRIIDACKCVLAPGGEIVQYSYRPISPLPTSQLGLQSQRVGLIFRNLPPATVWRFRKAA